MGTDRLRLGHYQNTFPAAHGVMHIKLGGRLGERPAKILRPRPRHDVADQLGTALLVLAGQRGMDSTVPVRTIRLIENRSERSQPSVSGARRWAEGGRSPHS